MIAKILKFLRGGPNPQAEYAHDVLGRMFWSEDDESWFGTYLGVRFSLAYDDTEVPSMELISYALEVLGDQVKIESDVRVAKQAATTEFGPDYSAEISSLTLGCVHFSGRKGQFSRIADLVGGEDYRCWRIEWNGSVCEGIGFDS